MKLNSKTHGVIDYIIAIFLFVSPSIFSLPYTSAVFTYGLATIHLVMTICTNYEYALTRFIPFKIHGAVELTVSILLIGVAFYLGGLDGDFSEKFYFGLAIVIFVFWLVSDYTNKPLERQEIPYVESNTDGGMI